MIVPPPAKVIYPFLNRPNMAKWPNYLVSGKLHYLKKAKYNPSVNFINVFTYERRFGSFSCYMYLVKAAKTNIRTFNVDEIDTW